MRKNFFNGKRAISFSKNRSKLSKIADIYNFKRYNFFPKNQHWIEPYTKAPLKLKLATLWRKIKA